MLGGRTNEQWISQYGSSHQHPVNLVCHTLGIPTILMGFGLPDDGLHSPNEKYKLENYYKGIMTIAHFFEQYGE